MNVQSPPSEFDASSSTSPAATLPDEQLETEFQSTTVVDEQPETLNSTNARWGTIGLALFFSITSFVSACLLFSVQPMLGKMILPSLGGTPAVWNTCMVFFQAVLLLGYLYSHLTTRWLGARRQAVIHLGLLLVPLLVLPLVAGSQWDNPPVDQPMFWLIAMLWGTAGLPFLAVSTSAPLLQKWFAGTGHPSAHDPYFLYAASNAGSMSALLGYPFVIEPLLSLADQSYVWKIGYIVMIVMTSVCAALLWFAKKGPSHDSHTQLHTSTSSGPQAAPVTLRRRMMWVLYAFAPSSLMLGVTTYVTTDVAAIPLLWVVPLALYLLTFVLAFSKRQLLPRKLMARVLAVLAPATMIALIIEANTPHLVLIPEHLLMFFTASMVCHGALAEDRPTANYLTEFYLWMSLGGVLGGIFNALVSPLLFTGIVEYPLVIVLACFFRPATGAIVNSLRETRRDFTFPAAVAVLTAVLAATGSWLQLDVSRYGALLLFAVPAFLTLSFSDRPVRFGLGLAAILLGSVFYRGMHGNVLDVERNFFGVVRITNDAHGEYRQMVHGNTIHGRESLDPKLRGVPLSYYHREGPAGDIFGAFSQSDTSRSVGCVGLGAGSLASYAEADQDWLYYEINSSIERFARNASYFSFLSDSPAKQLDVVLGDARLKMRDASDGAFGLIVLDAFSSDSIPMHLVTREAVALYLSKLAPDGILAFHVSNRYLRLEPVLGKLASDAALVSRMRFDDKIPPESIGREPSRWVVMAHKKEDLGPLAENPNWRALKFNAQTPTWTDDFSNILGLLR